LKNSVIPEDYYVEFLTYLRVFMFMLVMVSLLTSFWWHMCQ